MNTEIWQSADDRFSLWIYVTHFIAGLAVGMALYAGHLFLIAANMTGKPTAATGTAIGWGLLWPVLATGYGLLRAGTNPLVRSRSWGVALVVTLFLIICVIIGAGVCGILLIAMAFSGYC